MFRVLLAALIAAFFTSSAAAQDCEKPQAVMQRVFDRIPNARIMDPLTNTEIEAVIRGYNAIEPVSEFKADHLDVMAAPNFMAVLLIAHSNGCVVFADQMPVPLFLMLISGKGA